MTDITVVVLVGAKGIGKTQLLQKMRNRNHQLKKGENPTIGVDSFQIKHEADNTPKTFTIYDTAGQACFAEIVRQYYRAKIFLLGFDLTKKESLDELGSELSKLPNEIKKHMTNNCQYILVGTKADETDNIQVKPEDINAFKIKHQIKLYEETTATQYPENLMKALSTAAAKDLSPDEPKPLNAWDSSYPDKNASHPSSINSKLLLDLFIIGGGLVGFALCAAAIATALTIASFPLSISLVAAAGFFTVTSASTFIYRFCSTQSENDNESIMEPTFP